MSRLLFAWDEYEITESQIKCLMAEKGMSESEARDDAYDDGDFLTFAWQDLCEYAQEWMNKNDFYHFYVEGSKMGWRNRNGHKLFAASAGEEFIRRVVGLDCDYTLRLYEHLEPGSCNYHLYGTVSHHDSPTGESRVVYPVLGCDGCGEGIPPEEEIEVEGGTYCPSCAEYIRELLG